MLDPQELSYEKLLELAEELCLDVDIDTTLEDLYFMIIEAEDEAFWSDYEKKA